MRELHDHFFRLAKKEGYRSRAAYKLIEIDERRKLLQRGDRVLDCGCAPGSWLQVIARRIGPNGQAVGIDLQPVEPLPEPNVRILEADLTTIEVRTLLGDAEPFDVILSDMAPATTGDRTIDHHGSARLCTAVLDRCGELLRRGGHVAIKVLEGEAYPDLLARARTMFDRVKGFKPKASRGESTEIYLIAEGFRGDTAATQPQETIPPPPKPKGWGA